MAMFEHADTIPDTLSDEVGILLSRIRSLDTMNSEKRQLVEQAVELMGAQKYVGFPGQTQRYFLSRVGDSYLYDVPPNKSGYLKPFVGERVRVVCTGSGTRWNRHYMAGIVPKE